MIRRIMLWLRPNKKCSGLCLFCKYYEECSKDLEIQKEEAKYVRK